MSQGLDYSSPSALNNSASSPISLFPLYLASCPPLQPPLSHVRTLFLASHWGERTYKELRGY